MNTDPNHPPITAESLRIDPEQFNAMIDRSAGGPAYRRLICILRAVIAFIAASAVIGVVITLIALSRFATVLDRLDEGERQAEEQRTLIVEQNRILLECTTPSPPPGEPRSPDDDGVHECHDRGQARGNELAGGIGEAMLIIAECQRDHPANLRACFAERTRPP